MNTTSTAEQSAVQQAPHTIPAAIGAAFEGGLYAGIIRGVNGAPDEHLILLPGLAEDISWNDAMAWVAEQGGYLPTRREQALLFANLPEQFKPRYHWSCEQHAVYPTDAWGQGFGGGGQGYLRKSYAGCARLVRRLPI